jgi:LytS/YehU family sensor histidine kinase
VGNEAGMENAVCIAMQKDQELLKFRCFNTKQVENSNQLERRGIGMANARKRLELLYPEQHVLSIIDERTFFEVNLNIRIK